MDIEYHSSCVWDKLTITDLSGSISRVLCGSISIYHAGGGPLCISTSSRNLNIRFSSDGIVTRTGFILNYYTKLGANRTGNYSTTCERFYDLVEIGPTTTTSSTTTSPTTTSIPGS